MSFLGFGLKCDEHISVFELCAYGYISVGRFFTVSSPVNLRADMIHQAKRHEAASHRLSDPAPPL